HPELRHVLRHARMVRRTKNDRRDGRFFLRSQVVSAETLVVSGFSRTNDDKRRDRDGEAFHTTSPSATARAVFSAVSASSARDAKRVRISRVAASPPSAYKAPMGAPARTSGTAIAFTPGAS